MDNVTPVLGDCKIETPKFKADRIIMGYVKTTHHYLKVAVDSLNEEKKEEKEEIKKPQKFEVDQKAKVKNAKVISKAGKINKIKKYAPGVEHVVVDARIY